MRLKPTCVREGVAFALLPISLVCTDASAQALPGGTLDPTTIPKYVTDLVIPGVMKKAESDHSKRWHKGYKWKGKGKGDRHADYEIALRQFQQQMLPTQGCDPTVQPAGTCRGDGAFRVNQLGSVPATGKEDHMV